MNKLQKRFVGLLFHKIGFFSFLPSPAITVLVLGNVQAKAAGVWITLEGVVNTAIVSGDGGINAPVGSGTRWTLTGWLGERSDSVHTYGIDLLGVFTFSGQTYQLNFEAAQVEFDSAISSDYEDKWGVNVENETPDNPSEGNAFPGFHFNELYIGVKPWWYGSHAPPIGTSMPQDTITRFELWLDFEGNTSGSVRWSGIVDRVVVSIPEPTGMVFLAFIPAIFKRKRP